MLFSRLAYYLVSIPTLVSGVSNLPAALPALARRQAFVIRLRDGLAGRARTLMDLWVIKETCLDNQYETMGTRVQDGWTVIDIGGGLGDFAISVAKRHPGSRVYAYEPFPDSFHLFEENLALNAVKNCRVFREAVAGTPGTMQLHQVSGEAVQVRTLSESQQAGTDQQVRSLTLEQIWTELGLQSCEYMKVDCEGAEYQIFFNTSPAILGKIKHICLEYHDGVTPFSHADLARFFQEHGFQVKLRSNPVHQHLGFMYAWNPN